MGEFLPTWLKIGRSRPGAVEENLALAALTDPIRIVQRALAEPRTSGAGALSGALDAIVQQGLWRKVESGTGTQFESFGAFAIAPTPHGLGICCQVGARATRHALLENKHVGPWTEILELIARRPGRPRTIVNHDGFRFYKVSTATTSCDRLLLMLKRDYPEYFARVCDGACSPHRAGVDAGLIAPRKTTRLLFGVCDLHRAAQLRQRPQGKLLRELFRALSLDAQCFLLARELEPGLGTELSAKWRAKHSPPSSFTSGS